MPREVVGRLAEKGYLGALIPAEYGGTFTDMITFGLLNEELGRGCSSVRSLLTVHGMVQYAILRWGSEALKKHWLPRLATGEAIGAFGLTEPGTGSDAASIETSARPSGGSYVLDGTKVWTTFGQFADRLPHLRPAGRPDLHVPGGTGPAGILGHADDRIAGNAGLDAGHPATGSL